VGGGVGPGGFGEGAALLGTEHSFTPPAILPPNVASEHEMVPLNTLKKN
jgi:hypothetical protein